MVLRLPAAGANRGEAAIRRRRGLQHMFVLANRRHNGGSLVRRHAARERRGRRRGGQLHDLLPSLALHVRRGLPVAPTCPPRAIYPWIAFPRLLRHFLLPAVLADPDGWGVLGSTISKPRLQPWAGPRGSALNPEHIGIFPLPINWNLKGDTARCTYTNETQ